MLRVRGLLTAEQRRALRELSATNEGSIQMYRTGTLSLALCTSGLVFGLLGEGSANAQGRRKGAVRAAGHVRSGGHVTRGGWAGARHRRATVRPAPAARPMRHVITSRRGLAPVGRSRVVRAAPAPGHARRYPARRVVIRERYGHAPASRVHYVSPRRTRAMWVSRGGRPAYLYDDGVYWVRRHGGLVRTRPAIGITVPSLPARHTVVWRSGRPYYECDGVGYVRLAGGDFQVGYLTTDMY